MSESVEQTHMIVSVMPKNNSLIIAHRLVNDEIDGVHVMDNPIEGLPEKPGIYECEVILRYITYHSYFEPDEYDFKMRCHSSKLLLDLKEYTSDIPLEHDDKEADRKENQSDDISGR